MSFTLTPVTPCRMTTSCAVCALPRPSASTLMIVLPFCTREVTKSLIARLVAEFTSINPERSRISPSARLKLLIVIGVQSQSSELLVVTTTDVWLEDELLDDDEADDELCALDDPPLLLDEELAVAVEVELLDELLLLLTIITVDESLELSQSQGFA